jgi:hypothetical protein
LSDCENNKRERELEEYLNYFEKFIIPEFRQELEKYSNFRMEELKNKFKYKVLRKIKNVM